MVPDDYAEVLLEMAQAVKRLSELVVSISDRVKLQEERLIKLEKDAKPLSFFN